MDRRRASELTDPGFDVVDVLSRAGDARDAFLAALDADLVHERDVDALLVSDLLRSTGRVAATVGVRPVLVQLCGIVRAIDATIEGRIELVELRSGLALHAGRTDRFRSFGGARLALRTVLDVLEARRSDGAGAGAGERPLRAQLQLLHAELRAWLLVQLTGDPAGAVDRPARSATSMALVRSRDPRPIVEADGRRRAHDLVQELLHGADHHPVTGLLGAAWLRGWVAVPVAGERIGEDQMELARMAAALASIRTPQLWQVSRSRSPRWRIDGPRVVVGDGLRDSWQLTADEDGLQLAGRERNGATILTTPRLDLAYVEADAHHLVLGPPSLVEQVVGMPATEAIARFREWVEQQAMSDEDPPPHLLEVATRCGRLRRRTR